jgi:hypothetical protein
MCSLESKFDAMKRFTSPLATKSNRSNCPCLSPVFAVILNGLGVMRAEEPQQLYLSTSGIVAAVTGAPAPSSSASDEPEFRGVIDDPDGYVNLRSRPNANLHGCWFHLAHMLLCFGIRQ